VGRDYQAALGLSIFAPNSLNVYATNRPEYLRLQFPKESGWGSVLDAVYGFEHALTRVPTPSAPPPTRAVGLQDRPEASPARAPPWNGAHDTEFMISVQGFTLDAQARDSLDRAIRGAVLQTLAAVDLKSTLHISPLGEFAKAHGLEIQRAGATGLAVHAAESKQVH
jgi:hypothetical protein